MLKIDRKGDFVNAWYVSVRLGCAVEWLVGVYSVWILNAYLYGFTHPMSFNPTLAKPRDCLCYKKNGSYSWCVS